MGVVGKVVVLVCLATVVAGFRDVQDGAKILSDAVKDTYSIPLRSALRAVSEERKAINAGEYDDAEFNLISRMKTVEIPPAADSTDFYASTKQAQPPSRFNSRAKRSPQSSGGLKFDGQSSSKSPEKEHPKSIADKLPRSTSSIPQSSNVNFEGSSKDPNTKANNDEENKRLFPELYGYGSPYGHHGHGGGHYGGGHYGGHPYYPNAGYPHHGYPGGYYGNGGHYPVAGNIGYPGYPGVGAGSAASASASASGASGYRPGYGGGGLYGNGYYPGNGYYGGGGYHPGGAGVGTYPIIAGGGVPPPGIGYGGFFRDEDGKSGKVTAGASSSSDGKVTGGVSFE